MRLYTTLPLFSPLNEKGKKKRKVREKYCYVNKKHSESIITENIFSLNTFLLTKEINDKRRDKVG